MFQRELDVSDPFTFLFLKRGILQYVQVKPLLAIASLALKAIGKYNEGEFRADSGYLYVSIIYNASICSSLYCLAMFWLSISEDLKPFRPMPKFLCVKGILFFSFWQAAGVSVLASVGAIKKLGPYTDKEHISLGLTDTLICLEMPLFAIAHLAAFSHQDYIEKKLAYVGRMPMRYAFRDAFGFKDVLEDARVTLNGQGMDYREFEPSEGHMHQGLGRERRIRAGLRYSHGGRGKYWLPQPTASSRWGRSPQDGVHAPLLSEDADDIIQDTNHTADEEVVEVGFDLSFGGPDSEDEVLFASSRRYLFGDYNYPCIDASSEIARAEMWEEEERILNNERSAWFSGHHGRYAIIATSYGAVGVSQPQQSKSCAAVSPDATISPEPASKPAGDRSIAQLHGTDVPGPPKSRLKSGPYPGAVRVPSSSLSTEIGTAGLASRPDAVDLVTGGSRAQERKAGEPAWDAPRETQRLPVGDLGSEGVVEGSNNRLTTHRDAEGVETNSADRATVEVVSQVEPPPHVRMRGLANVFDDLENNENPWA